MQRADRAGLKVPDEALNQALAEIAQRNSIPLSQLPEALAAQGIDYASYRDSMRKELMRSLLRQRDRATSASPSRRAKSTSTSSGRRTRRRKPPNTTSRTS